MNQSNSFNSSPTDPFQEFCPVSPSLTGTLAHEVLTELFESGHQFHRPVSTDRVSLSIDRRISSHTVLHHAARRRLFSQVSSGVFRYLGTCSPGQGWLFAAANSGLGIRDLGRPDLLFINPAGLILADELKFGQSTPLPMQPHLAQARRYAKGLSTAFGGKFLGVRLIHRSSPTTSLFIRPDGAVIPLSRISLHTQIEGAR